MTLLIIVKFHVVVMVVYDYISGRVWLYFRICIDSFLDTSMQINIVTFLHNYDVV